MLERREVLIPETEPYVCMATDMIDRFSRSFFPFGAYVDRLDDGSICTHEHVRVGFFFQVKILYYSSPKFIQSIAASSKAWRGPGPNKVMILPSRRANLAKLSFTLF